MTESYERQPVEKKNPALQGYPLGWESGIIKAISIGLVRWFPQRNCNFSTPAGSIGRPSQRMPRVWVADKRHQVISPVAAAKHHQVFLPVVAAKPMLRDKNETNYAPGPALCGKSTAKGSVAWQKNGNRKGRVIMLAYTYVAPGNFALVEKPKPTLQQSRDAIVKVTYSSICTSDLHIKHGSVPRAVPGITVGHEMVGIVEQLGADVTGLQVGDRVVVNVETFCGTCFFCQKGWVNNCTDPNGGWALGCRIDGGQAAYVRVPYGDTGLTRIPDTVTDLQALFVGDILATGYWAAEISHIGREDTVLILGAGPTGLCTLQCVRLYHPKRILVCEADSRRRELVRRLYPEVLAVGPEELPNFVKKNSDHGGADVVLEVAGGRDTFTMAWQCARPNGVVTLVALYDEAQSLPLPEMYGKNLTFLTGGVDGCHCKEILDLIAAGKVDTTPLITHTFPLKRIQEAYDLFEDRREGVLKVAVDCTAET